VRDRGVTSHSVRALVCKELGSFDDVVVTDRDDPAPGPGQAVIEVKAAGANYVDGLMCLGRYQIKIPAPFVPGSEVAGVVSALADEPSTYSVGDKVMSSCGFGGFAQKVLVRTDSLVPIPDQLDFARAAAFIQSYSTAWFALARRTRVSEGEQVLVLGAGGGVGLACVDVATALGAKVIAAASSKEKLVAAKEAGAGETIAYEDEDLKTTARAISGGGVDVVVDPVGGHHSEPALRALGRFGRLCVIGFASGTIATVPLNQVLLNNRTVIGVDWGAWAMRNPGENQEVLAELVENLSAGRLHPVAPLERPLDDAVAVMAGLMDRTVTGKVVLVP
jgi:NADPH:quinone reductase